MFYLNSGDENTSSVCSGTGGKPTNALSEALCAVASYMQKRNFGIRNGCIYKKPTEAKYTFVYCSSVEEFLLHSLKDEELRESIILHVNSLINLLSKPACKVIKPIEIDFNFIECLPQGYCFDIFNKCFVKDPADLKGSPRAFVAYEYVKDSVPLPRPFIEG